MKKIQNFGDFKQKEIKKESIKQVEPPKELILTERVMNPTEVAEIKAKILAELEAGKAKIGKMFGPKSEEELKAKLKAKYSNYTFIDEVLYGAAPKYKGEGDRDGMRHDDEPGLPWDDFNSPNKYGFR